MSGPVARRRAVGLLFFVNGLSMPALLPRLPQIRDAVGADPAAFGLALLGTGVGGTVGSMLTPRVLAWLGPRLAAVAFAVLLAGATVLVGVAGSVAMGSPGRSRCCSWPWASWGWPTGWPTSARTTCCSRPSAPSRGR